MIKIEDPKECCGCSACVQRCPKSCISFNEDVEGFRYPLVDLNLCIDCHLCEKVCPIINTFEAVNPLKAFATKNPDETIRANSSSGGVFNRLASYILSNGGVVFGAVFDENFEVCHTMGDSEADIPGMMRSKYVQSRINNTYSKAESELKSGRQVLFAGTPCQIAGLYRFLRKDYDNLITLDFVCHGVPSAKIWRQYLEEVCLSRFNSNKPISVNFRVKNGFGAKEYGFEICGKRNDGEIVKFIQPASENAYMQAFVEDLTLRPSCYDCRFKGGKSNADLTIGDFWGLDRIDEKFEDDKGVNLVIIKSEKGLRIFENLDLTTIEVPFERAIHPNKSYYESAKEPAKRHLLFKELSIYNGTIKVLKKATRKSLLKKTKKLSKKVIKRILRTFK